MGCAPIAAAASISRSLPRAVIATRAPAAVNISAAARPMPELPPVTNETAFFRFINRCPFSIGLAREQRLHKPAVDGPRARYAILLHFKAARGEHRRELARLGRLLIAAEHLAQQIGNGVQAMRHSGGVFSAGATRLHPQHVA